MLVIVAKLCFLLSVVVSLNIAFSGNGKVAGGHIVTNKVAQLRIQKNVQIAASASNENVENVGEISITIKDVGVVLLAGGKGTRMKAVMPKQFLPLLGKPVFLRSLDVFQTLPKEVVSSIVIVLDASFRDEYQYLEEDKRIVWADPGVERQDSVFNGLMSTPDSCSVVAVHDAARPLVTQKEVMDCIADAIKHGAAVLGVPMKATVKESEDGEFVLKTINRSRLWEIHTPQISTKATFLKGFEKIRTDNLEVTDDVSVVEALGLPVKLTRGEYTNIKLTTPDDLAVAEQVLLERGVIPTPTGGGGEGYPCISERYRDSLGRGSGSSGSGSGSGSSGSSGSGSSSSGSGSSGGSSSGSGSGGPKSKSYGLSGRVGKSKSTESSIGGSTSSGSGSSGSSSSSSSSGSGSGSDSSKKSSSSSSSSSSGKSTNKFYF